MRSAILFPALPWNGNNSFCSLLLINVASPSQTVREDGLQQNSLDVGTHLMTELAKLRDKYEIIGDVRGKGLMIGVEMVKDKVCAGAGGGNGSLLPQ